MIMNQAPRVNMPTNQLDLRLLSTTGCTGGSCPTIYDSGRGTIIVQGYTVPAEGSGVAVPAGEQLVEIPVDVLRNAVRAMA
ncbi:hypothetical protein GCM10009687_71470 [Asanoa iriomotensis]|uniref:Uncharacterized protein n=1 Tax=Asanoa iriomotensis TaxID=234613 RepID=A0ABQ4C216_9ACTN|nr:hypothetical protein Air01nite_25660 [Asanoa iriomotensis]